MNLQKTQINPKTNKITFKLKKKKKTMTQTLRGSSTFRQYGTRTDVIHQCGQVSGKIDDVIRPINRKYLVRITASRQPAHSRSNRISTSCNFRRTTRRALCFTTRPCFHNTPLHTCRGRFAWKILFTRFSQSFTVV